MRIVVKLADIPLRIKKIDCKQKTKSIYLLKCNIKKGRHERSSFLNVVSDIFIFFKLSLYFIHLYIMSMEFTNIQNCSFVSPCLLKMHCFSVKTESVHR